MPLSSTRVVPLSFLLPLFVGCAPAETADLTIYSPHGREQLRHFAERFEAENPGISVTFVDMGSQEILDRLRAERVNPQADVWWGAPGEIFDQGAEAGLTSPYRPSWASALPPEAIGAGDHWFGTYRTPEVIAFNTVAVSPEEAPQEWDDILAPRWRDEVLIREPLASGTMRAIFASIIERERAATGRIEAGWEWLLKLDAQTREYVLNPTLLYQKLARGEGSVTLWTMPDIEMLKAEGTFPVDYVLPSGGTPVVMDGVAIVEGAPNRARAEAFVEFIGSEPEILEAAHRFFRVPARTDLDETALPEWLRDALPRIVPMDVDPDAVRENGDAWMRYWDESIRRRGRAEGY